MNDHETTKTRGERIHRAVSRDGTEIVGRVRGQGAPLVLVPGGPGDSETTWRSLLPLLREHFTCYAMDTRGRGLSGDHPDHSPERLVEDITTYVESIGEPVGLVSAGNVEWPLVAAQDDGAVAAVAAWEPIFETVRDDEGTAVLEDVFARVGARAAEGRLDEAARVWVDGLAAPGFYTIPEDTVDGAAPAFWQASAANIPLFVHQVQLEIESDGPDPADPSVLAQVTVPALLLHGSRTHHAHVAFVHHAARHLPDAQVREIAGAGHFGFYTEPQAVAGELLRFFGAAHQQPAVYASQG